MPKIVHIVLWKLRPQATAEALAQIQKGVDKLLTVPGPVTVHTGPPLLDARAKGFNYGIYSVFDSREALDTYATSEAHLKVVVENIRPNSEDLIAYDFVIEE